MAKVKLPGLLPMVTPPMSGKVLRLEFRLRCERGECSVFLHNFCKRYFGPDEASHIL
jgi:hypothetical protein